MAAKALSMSLVLGGVLGSGWAFSIGKAKKDIGLIDRMASAVGACEKCAF